MKRLIVSLITRNSRYAVQKRPVEVSNTTLDIMIDHATKEGALVVHTDIRIDGDQLVATDWYVRPRYAGDGSIDGIEAIGESPEWVDPEVAQRVGWDAALTIGRKLLASIRIDDDILAALDESSER